MSQTSLDKDNKESSIIRDLKAASVEFIGTNVFFLLAFGGVQAARMAMGPGASSTVEFLFYASASFGLALLASAWMFYRVTGGLFNPAVSFALLLTRKIGPVRFVLYFIAQLLGGMSAAGIISALTPGPTAFGTSLGAGVNRARGLFVEVFTTATLCMAVLMLAVEKHRSTPVAPIGIGLTLFVCNLWSYGYTGAGINPARSFGPAVVEGFDTYHWIYWVGPLAGAALAAAVYTWLKYIRYRTLDPGQEDTYPGESTSKRDVSTKGGAHHPTDPRERPLSQDTAV